MAWAKVDDRPTTADYWPGVLRSPWEAETHVMPLLAFPAAEQATINALADAPTPPPRWIRRELCELPSRAWWEWHARRGRAAGCSREHIASWLREAVVMRDCGVCQLCGKQVGPADPLHLDHVRPHSLGGETTLGNLQLAHATCNMRKGNRV